MSRSYCFTLNNPTEDEILNVEKHTGDKKNFPIRYMIYGCEIGKESTPHLQGYLELHTTQRISYLKKLIGFERGHFEPRKGTREQARNYCMKDGTFYEFGDWNAGGQGKRNDIRQIIDLIQNHTPKLDIFDAIPEIAANNLNFIKEYTAALEKEETKAFREVEVTAYIGDAGTGKTRKVHEENDDVFTVNADEAFPFDGYDGEKTILIDDFYGDIKYHSLLRILDGHQYRVNVKGSHRYARWTKVFITSNKQPSEWYKAGLTPALARRLKNVTEFCHKEAGNTEPPLNI